MSPCLLLTSRSGKKITGFLCVANPGIPIHHNGRTWHWEDGHCAGFVTRDGDGINPRTVPRAVWRKMYARVYGCEWIDGVSVKLSEVEIAKILAET